MKKRGRPEASNDFAAAIESLVGTVKQGFAKAYKMIIIAGETRKELRLRMHWNRRRIAALTVASAFAAGTVAAGTFFVLSPSVAHARRQDGGPVFLFRGDLTNGSVSLGGWGSGNAEATKEVTPPFGGQAIKITTHGLYQGGRLDFSSPINLNTGFANSATYLRFTVRFQGAGARTTGFNSAASQDTTQAISPFKRMRYLLTMADGSRFELIRPTEIPPSDDPDRWVQLSFPLAAIVKANKGKMPTGDGARLKSLSIFGDKYQQFYLAEISTVIDETEISVAPLEDQVFFAGQETVFVGNAEGGAATLKYSWDFDSSDGIQEDAVGRVVSHVFPRTGGEKKYNITLTVSDYDGIKKAVKTPPLEAVVSD